MIKKQIAVYGTLKKGFWNYDRYLTKQKFIGKDIIIGAMQMASGGYPYLFEKGNKVYDIEIYDVEIDIFNKIKAMEEGSGYYTSLIDTHFGECYIFWANANNFQSDKEIIDKF